jgi:hypothetical protein
MATNIGIMEKVGLVSSEKMNAPGAIRNGVVSLFLRFS